MAGRGEESDHKQGGRATVSGTRRVAPDTSTGQAGEESAAKTRKPGKSAEPSNHDPTRLYLSEIGASPLLTAKEEVHYSRLAQKGDEEARKHMSRSRGAT
jgi:RNA polymerase nonessential primary-like sigma factor